MNHSSSDSKLADFIEGVCKFFNCSVSSVVLCILLVLAYFAILFLHFLDLAALLTRGFMRLIYLIAGFFNGVGGSV